MWLGGMGDVTLPVCASVAYDAGNWVAVSLVVVSHSCSDSVKGKPGGHCWGFALLVTQKGSRTKSKTEKKLQENIWIHTVPFVYVSFYWEDAGHNLGE